MTEEINKNPAVQDITIGEIRPEILEFAKAMEKKMRVYDDQKGDMWKRIHPDYLMIELKANFDKTYQETEPLDFADIGNYCMFLFHRYTEKRDWGMP